MDIFIEHIDEFAEGLLTTVELTLLCFAMAMAIAVVITSFRVSPIVPLRMFGTGYVELFQNVPLLAWLAVFMYALPEIGIQFELFPTAMIAVGMYSAAYYAEVIRSGVNTVSKGQTEAARALGLGFGQSLRLVVLPQALRSVIQPLNNVTIGLLMNTALVAGIGVLDLTEAAHRVILEEADPLVIFIGIGIIYGVLALIISTIFGVLERKLVIHR